MNCLETALLALAVYLNFVLCLIYVAVLILQSDDEVPIFRPSASHRARHRPTRAMAERPVAAP